MFEYKKNHSVEEREAEANRLLARHPDLLPIIIEKHPRSQLPDPEKSKFLAPANLKTSDLVHKIRSKLTLTKEQALMVFIDGTVIMPVDKKCCEIYDLYKSEDKFLYVLYAEQESFGN